MRYVGCEETDRPATHLHTWWTRRPVSANRTLKTHTASQLPRAMYVRQCVCVCRCVCVLLTVGPLIPVSPGFPCKKEIRTCSHIKAHKHAGQYTGNTHSCVIQHMEKSMYSVHRRVQDTTQGRTYLPTQYMTNTCCTHTAREQTHTEAHHTCINIQKHDT